MTQCVDQDNNNCNEDTKSASEQDEENRTKICSKEDTNVGNNAAI